MRTALGNIARSALFAGICGLLVVDAASAQGRVFEPPLGCTLEYTVQTRGCEVENVFICPTVASGHSWTARFSSDGLLLTGRLDENAQWREIFFADGNPPLRVTRPIEDPFEIDKLFAEGFDSQQFTMAQTGLPPMSFTGYDRLQDSVVIDGEPLIRIDFEMISRNADGTVVAHRRGEGFVSERFRRFFGGRERLVVNGTEEPGEDTTPVEFIYPGERGFGSMRPLYDCGVISALPEGLSRG